MRAGLLLAVLAPYIFGAVLDATKGDGSMLSLSMVLDLFKSILRIDIPWPRRSLLGNSWYVMPGTLKKRKDLI